MCDINNQPADRNDGQTIKGGVLEAAAGLRGGVAVGGEEPDASASVVVGAGEGEIARN
jgi:hypothetical protein